MFPGLFFCARESGLEKRSGPRGFVPLCHCVTSPWGEWKRLSPFRSLARFLEIGEYSRSLFLRPRVWFGETLRASRFRTPLSLRDISLGRMETSVAVSVARTFFRDWGVLLGLFFFACGSCLEKRSGPRGLVPLCHCVTSPWGERKRLPPFRSLARFLEIGEYSSVSFFAPARRVRDNRSGLRGLVPLCHCVTSPEGERKRLSPGHKKYIHLGMDQLIFRPSFLP